MKRRFCLKPPEKGKTVLPTMKKAKPIIVLVLLIANILVAVCLILSYMAGYFSPQKAWILAFFGLAYPIFLSLNLFFILIWLATWNRYIFISLITVLAGWNTLMTIFPVRLSKPGHIAGTQLKVTTFNIHSLYGTQQGDNVGETRNRVTDFLAGNDADIVCIQEFYAIGEDFNVILTDFMRKIKLEHYHFRNYQEFWNKKKINAIATFSRFPVVRTGSYKLPDKSIYAIFTDLLINGDTVRVFNVHLESIRFGNDDYSFFSHLTEPGMEKTPLEIGSKKMMWKLRKAFKYRATQVESLNRDISGSPYPVILAGDFNDSPCSYTYHQLTDNLSDAYTKAGSGLFGSTYSGQFPAFRIDYILYSEGFKALDYRKEEVNISDHFPVSASLVLSK
jgi:endonuclease/exonuclease/phosphatase family metal-dependent hydrolase